MTSPLLRLTTLALLIAATGCRSLPSSWDPPEPTYAMAPAEAGPLVDVVSESEARLPDGASGFFLIEDAEDALHWRLALVDSATQSIDVQTFLWHRDFAGGLLVKRIIEAADRGVRARLLVDDWERDSRGDLGLATLDDHPNIEVRVWNPGRNREFGRRAEYLVRLRELNYRMHNKVFVVDNRVAVTGGRNIGDEYFGLSDKYNMLDLDLIAVGPVVPALSSMFDVYWNSQKVAPGSIFHPAGGYHRFEKEFARGVRRLEQSPFDEIFPLERRDWTDALTTIDDRVIPATYEVLYDAPGEPGAPAPDQGTFEGLARFIAQAETEIVSINPYVVPRRDFDDDIKVLTDRGVRFALLTNSLGSTNQVIVNHAYANRRRPMLEAGMEVYELRADGAMKQEVDTPPAKSKHLALHAKAIVLDREHLYIGSYNFSPRSRNINTEMGLLLHSPELGAHVADHLERTMQPDNAWRVTLDENNRMRWTSSDQERTSAPSSGFGRQMKDIFYSFFPVEDHL